MDIFKNFIVVVILVGVVTRASKYFLSKHIDDKKTVVYVSSIGSSIGLGMLATFLVGFDVVVSEYLITFILWFVFDLMRLEATKEE